MKKLNLEVNFYYLLVIASVNACRRSAFITPDHDDGH